MTAVTTAGKTERARENRAYLRRLLSERQPDFYAALQLAARQVDRELSGESPPGRHLAAPARISDDGTGGADEARGSGIVGLRDRVEALRRTMALASPQGGGTTITALAHSSPGPAKR
jgi:hypothetical protein